MANLIFNGFKQYVLDGTVNLETDTIKCALFDNAFTPNKDTMDNWDDISADEISGSGYPAGGIELAGKTFSHNDTSDIGIFDANDVVFEAVTLTNARFVILYKVDTGTAAKLIGSWDFGSDQNPAGVDFTVKWNAAGILNTQ